MYSLYRKDHTVVIVKRLISVTAPKKVEMLHSKQYRLKKLCNQDKLHEYCCCSNQHANVSCHHNIALLFHLSDLFSKFIEVITTWNYWNKTQVNKLEHCLYEHLMASFYICHSNFFQTNVVKLSQFNHWKICKITLLGYPDYHENNWTILPDEVTGSNGEQNYSGNP